ncbi:gluconolaconase [Parapedobacter pyrenivorans]|uniref:Gluconolaconase n=1 Tax=Parapedobacter pyrenivorans TaxID=1305674 RepID=A0A917MHC9_9SPHI|nr:SMP-30/gluconolactonase/LRE family protein [Parapedobacter pyrenivorans]GGH03573.1 gluconolaconase [Parapedobacter pyrenivorans]
MMFNEKQVKKVDAPACKLGESPMWHSGRNSAFWVDILGNAIFEYKLDDGAVKQYAGSRMISLICQVDGNDNLLVAGAQGGIGTYNLESHELLLISDLERDWENHRCNDGAVDCFGNLWVGTTHVDHEPGAGDLYRVSGSWHATKKIERVSIPNGMCWSADRKTLFHTDSPTREIKAYRNDVATGEITFDRIAVQVPASMGFPDGISMDTAGTIWVAIWGGSGVGGFNSVTGELAHWIPMPVPHVSSCAFVGPALDRLLVTTAQKEMSDEQLAQYPDSGSTFLVEMAVSGLPTHDCQLPIA